MHFHKSIRLHSRQDLKWLWFSFSGNDISRPWKWSIWQELWGGLFHISLFTRKNVETGFMYIIWKVHQKFNCNQLINFSKSNRKNANIFNCMRQKARVTDCMRQKARVTDFSELTHSISIKIKAKRDLGLTTLRLEWNDNKLKTGQKPFMKYFFVS